MPARDVNLQGGNGRSGGRCQSTGNATCAPERHGRAQNPAASGCADRKNNRESKGAGNAATGLAVCLNRTERNLTPHAVDAAASRNDWKFRKVIYQPLEVVNEKTGMDPAMKRVLRSASLLPRTRKKAQVLPSWRRRRFFTVQTAAEARSAVVPVAWAG